METCASLGARNLAVFPKYISIIEVIIIIGDIVSSTTIAVSMETKEMLRTMGEKGESYDEIIRKLIEEVGLKELDSRWNKILAEDKFIPLDEL